MKKTVVVNKFQQDYDVYIGRGSKWGNPFEIGKDGDREEVIEKYEIWIKTQPQLLKSLHELRGKKLGCFCRPKHCHGDVLTDLIEEMEKNMPNEEKIRELNDEIKLCKKCRLHESRIQTVPGNGDTNALILVVGEAPGQTEDEQGIPLCGRSGKLYNTWLYKELGLERKDVFTCNILKCRPPKNRAPLSDEVEMCASFLSRQIEIIKPKIIITLGRVPLQSLFKNTNLKMTKEHGVWRKYKDIDLMPIYHPAFLLRQMSEENKKAVKDDFAKIKEKLNEMMKGK